ncbi:MAG: hypothetical protein GY853_01655 [PVC group bacterium]|nr:hypothetical protein [PVC group bacterium]
MSIDGGDVRIIIIFLLLIVVFLIASETLRSQKEIICSLERIEKKIELQINYEEEI